MKISRLFLGAFVVAILSVFYNLSIFYIFDFYPDRILEAYSFGRFGIFFVIFLKNYFVGFVLMLLFGLAYKYIEGDKLTGNDASLGTLFFILYAIFALFAFTVGDMLLMGTLDGMFVLLTFDGIIETLIATIPIRFFSVQR